MADTSSSDPVEDLRQKGNYEFQQGNLDHAIALYTAAIDQATGNALIINLCNRSACSYQLQDYESARDDALQAWKLSGETHVKAAYRLAKTYIALEDYATAIATLTPLISASSTLTLEDQEQKGLEDLLSLANKKESEPKPVEETTIKGANRTVSIREFTKGKSLGVGNFSEIVVVTHKQTKEKFALKILEKKQAADLAKRQHPNVYNEIAMEARVLLERLPPHPRMVQMYHSFGDYNNLYYLMDLHSINTDLWSCIRHKGKMVGCHPSMTQRWLWQLIDALEHFHRHGIVHRDLKPENILLNSRNHVVVIDFGTAKDLIQTDLNGPEFVGTPDFMSPEAVTGFSGMPGDTRNTKGDYPVKAATHAADLWALGAVAYILHTGSCPFWSPSPYLTFLRIKRGLLPRNDWAMPDDEAWSFCRQLMQVKPNDRLGASAFAVTTDANGKNVVSTSEGYDVLRNHPYFTKSDKTDDDSKAHIIPSLQDLCIRACSEMAQKDANDLDLCDQHPPGDGSAHDLLRLSDRQRKLIWHVLDKSRVFKDGDETRVFQRFFAKDVDFLKAKVRQETRDFVGWTQMNDDEYKPQSARGSQDPYAKKDDPVPTKLVIVCNPWLTNPENEGSPKTTPEQEKAWFKGWKNCISHINKQRPNGVIACAPHLPSKYWKTLSRVRDTIPVLWNDGSAYYTFWVNGFQGIVLQKAGFLKGSSGTEMAWLQEQMEQSRMAKPQLFCFCDCDPRELPALVLKRLARGRALCLYGVSAEPLDYSVAYTANETVDDDVSVKSTESVEDDADGWTMRVLSSNTNGMHWLTVDEKEGWMTSFENIDMPSVESNST